MGAEPATVLTVEAEGAVRRVTLARPDALNALNGELFSHLANYLRDIAADPTAGCLLIRGAGERAFSAGADLNELLDLDAAAARELLRRGQQVMREIELLPIPTIAAVDGYALGGGFELTLVCTFVLASDRARFGLPEVRLGLMPGYGGTQRLRRRVPTRAALAMMLSGDPIDAHRAWELELLSAPPLPAGKLYDVAEELAGRLAENRRTANSLILEATRPDDISGLEHEAALAAIAIGSPRVRKGSGASWKTATNR